MLAPHASAVLALLLSLAAPARERLAVPAPPAAAVPSASADVRARIETYLDSIDAPVTPAQWRALGPDAAPVLEAIAQDPKRLPTRRARALGALAIVGSPRAPQLTIDLAQRETEKPVVRMSALRAAGQLLDPAALTTALMPILERAQDLHVRAAAAETLALHNPAACPPVRAQSAREKLESRSAFTRALKTCDASK
jgi:hypothetical protein